MTGPVRRPRISIHALREEGDEDGGGIGSHSLISIHALREEGDRGPRKKSQNPKISIHALREEGDSQSAHAPADAEKFLSTPSARRATSEPADSCGQL